MAMQEVKNSKIYEAISNVMEDIGAVGKNQKNKQQGFMFRGIDDVMNAINPALVKNRVFITPEILEQSREERTTKNGSTLIYSICKIKYTFYTDDGSNIQATVIGEGMDSGDKATNKAMAIAFKYACFQVFCIPTEEMRDPDSEVHNVSPKHDTDKRMPKQEAEPATNNKITSKQHNDVSQELLRTGLKTDMILSTFKIKKIGDMTQAQYTVCMKKLSKTPDFIPPETIDVPDSDKEELPFV